MNKMKDSKTLFCPVCGILVDDDYNPKPPEPTKSDTSGVDIILGVCITLIIELIVIGTIFSFLMM